MRIQNILFDLDGTLTDPAEGITRCFQHSLNRLDKPCPSQAELASHIGPPIRQAFATILQSSDETLIEEALAIYRERFSTIGLFENSVYEGVPEMLSRLHSLGYRLLIATSKPQVYAEKILEHFALNRFFIEVHGNELSGRLDDKAELLSELIARHKLDAAATLMVGDRWHDIVAAKKNGVRSLGVTYGYGSREELREAGADCLCDRPEEIVSCIEDGIAGPAGKLKSH
jgi:phosphoglycolate phosphatase